MAKADDICVFCGAPATKLCDFPMGYPPDFAGHVPRALQIFDNDGNEISRELLVPCSRPICDSCSTQYHDLDFCPHCVKEFCSTLEEKKFNKAASWVPKRVRKNNARRGNNG